MPVANLHLDILLPALAAGIIVLSTHVPLGREVLARGIIFIDLAIAQIAGLGVIAASITLESTNVWLVQLSAVVFAMFGAVLFNWIERHWPAIQEALIGVAFILAATASLILLANDPHAGENLKELLVGQILWVNWQQLILPAVISGFILAVWLLYRKPGPSWLFYALFAVAITVSVQLVGVYLVFASLIIPAIVSYQSNGPQNVAYITGVLGYVVGLIASSILDLPAGPIIVWSLAIVALLVALFMRCGCRILKN